jgi:uncharacterized protein
MKADSNFDYRVEHQLRREQIDAGLALIGRFLDAERCRPGCLGVEGPALLRCAADSSVYLTHTRWRDLESFLSWMESPQRRALQEQGRSHGYASRGSASCRSYDQWLQAADNEQTPIWKVNLIVLMTLYPTVLTLQQIQRGWPGDRATAILLANIASIALTGWLFVPWASSLYRRWLQGRLGPRGRILAPASILLWICGCWLLAHRLG